MKDALALRRDSLCRLLTPGFFLPSLGRLIPSAIAPPTQTDPIGANSAHKRFYSFFIEVFG